MKVKINDSSVYKFVASLMKGKSESEIQEATENFKEYILFVKKICDEKARERRLKRASSIRDDDV